MATHSLRGVRPFYCHRDELLSRLDFVDKSRLQGSKLVKSFRKQIPAPINFRPLVSEALPDRGEALRLRLLHPASLRGGIPFVICNLYLI